MSATLHHTPARRSAPFVGDLLGLGTTFTALALLSGPVIAAVMLAGYLDGPSNALAALWFVPLVAFPAGLGGGICQAIAAHHDRRQLRTTLVLTGITLIGLLGGLVLPSLGGLDGDTSSTVPTLATVLRTMGAVFTAVYLAGLLALTATGVRRMTHHRPAGARHAALP